jgi:hypothetical protein
VTREGRFHRIARTFQCREDLWSEFEEMARDLDCSVDYLLNEALKRYARETNRRRSPPPPSTPRPAAGPPPLAAFALPAPARVQPPTVPRLAIAHADGTTIVGCDRFIIGRSRSMSHLTIKDPNISRQHALVEEVDGRHFLVDMGSTNGLEWRGEPLSRKLIDDGDVITICGHVLRFSYRLMAGDLRYRAR